MYTSTFSDVSFAGFYRVLYRRFFKVLFYYLLTCCLFCCPCSESQGKHTSPVWQVRWVDRDQGSGEERDEILISISADGRVTKWSIRKGFESTGRLYCNIQLRVCERAVSLVSCSRTFQRDQCRFFSIPDPATIFGSIPPSRRSRAIQNIYPDPAWLDSQFSA